MCGRLDQHDVNKRFAELAATCALMNRSIAVDRWNVPPGTYPPVMHVEDGALVVDDVFWSYRPAWAAAAQPVPPKNCLLYTSPSPRDRTRSRMPSSA